MKQSPIILHIPHSSVVIPPEVRRSFLLSEEEIAGELLRLTDLYTDQLYAPRPSEFAHPLVYPVSRMVVDPERFPDDSQEPMVKHGQGVVYVSTQDGRPLRNTPGKAERETLLQTYYYPHHRQLTALVTEQLLASHRCLIIDCHSFPEEPFPFEENKERPRPDICIGTDAFHTPDQLGVRAGNFFRKAGYTVDFNHPFSGALVPLTFYRANPGVFSLMIELNRKCYMDEKTGEKNSGFNTLQKDVLEILEDLAGMYGSL